MAIYDVHAIPETAEDCTEYEQEADNAWDADDVERACDLYRALSRSALSTGAQASKAHHRLGLIALNAGDRNTAWDMLSQSKEPGAAELLKSIDLATPDVTPDFNRPPASTEETDTYWELGAAARKSEDWATAAKWFEAIATSSANDSGVQARAMFVLADALHRLGRDDDAKGWLRLGLPAVDDPEILTPARELALELGIHVSGAGSPAEAALSNGIGSFQMGELADATKSLEAVANLEGATPELIGKAEYYLGSMAYHARDYSAARAHFQRAEQQAPVPECAWAADMLKERWGED